MPLDRLRQKAFGICQQLVRRLEIETSLCYWWKVFSSGQLVGSYGAIRCREACASPPSFVGQAI